MLTITDTAAEAIKGIVASPQVPEGAGLRIATRPESPAGGAFEVTRRPRSGRGGPGRRGVLGTGLPRAPRR
jgi:hypothetical protein